MWRPIPTVTGIPIRRSGAVSANLQQVRFKRKPAYPTYKADVDPISHRKKDHRSYFQRHIKKWLGPRNMKGEYYRNKYFYPPQDHKPNYIVADGRTVVDGSSPSFQSFRSGAPGRDPSVHPFPDNTATKTASMIPITLKETIYQRVVENGEDTQTIANDYKIKIARVEAIVALQRIENQLKDSVCLGLSRIYALHQ